MNKNPLKLLDFLVAAETKSLNTQPEHTQSPASRHNLSESSVDSHVQCKLCLVYFPPFLVSLLKC